MNRITVALDTAQQSHQQIRLLSKKFCRHKRRSPCAISNHCVHDCCEQVHYSPTPQYLSNVGLFPNKFHGTHQLNMHSTWYVHTTMSLTTGQPISSVLIRRENCSGVDPIHAAYLVVAFQPESDKRQATRRSNARPLLESVNAIFSMFAQYPHHNSFPFV